MKKLIIFIFFLSIIYTSKGQNQFQNSTFSTNGNVYSCSISGKYVIIQNQQNILDHPQSRYSIKNFECMDLFGGDGGLSFVKSKIQNQFTPTRVTELEFYGQTGFTLSFWLNTSGIIKELYFTIRKDTKLTPQEIYNMERSLKNVQVPFSMRNCPITGTGYFLYSPNISFNGE